MGANGWSYFTSYQPDIEQALHDLQREMFENGDYWLRDYSDLTLKAMLPPDYKEWMDDKEFARYRATFRRLRYGPKPQTIEELREWNADEGCGSILDMLRVGLRGTYGTISLASPGELEEMFGTQQPSHEQVVRSGNRPFSYCDRGEGRAIIVYQDGMPNEVFFVGISGD